MKNTLQSGSAQRPTAFSQPPLLNDLSSREKRKSLYRPKDPVALENRDTDRRHVETCWRFSLGGERV
jgi:hypothetical protein